MYSFRPFFHSIANIFFQVASRPGESGDDTYKKSPERALNTFEVTLTPEQEKIWKEIQHHIQESSETQDKIHASFKTLVQGILKDTEKFQKLSDTIHTFKEEKLSQIDTNPSIDFKEKNTAKQALVHNYTKIELELLKQYHTAGKNPPSSSEL